MTMEDESSDAVKKRAATALLTLTVLLARDALLHVVCLWLCAVLCCAVLCPSGARYGQKGKEDGTVHALWLSFLLCVCVCVCVCVCFRFELIKYAL